MHVGLAAVMPCNCHIPAAVLSGGSWQGKKVTFDQEAVVGADTAVPGEVPGSEQREEEQHTVPAAAGSFPSSAGAATSDRGPSSKAGTQKEQKKKKERSKRVKVKRVKLAVRQLQEAPGGVLKWSKLWKQLKQAAQQQHLEAEGSCKERAWRKLQGCSRLQVTGKLVSLGA